MSSGKLPIDPEGVKRLTNLDLMMSLFYWRADWACCAL